MRLPRNFLPEFLGNLGNLKLEHHHFITLHFCFCETVDKSPYLYIMKGCAQAGYWVLLFPDTHERLLLTESPGGPGGPVGPAGPSKPYISKTRSCYDEKHSSWN